VTGIDPTAIQSHAGGRDWLTFALGVYGAIVASCVAGYQILYGRTGVRLVLAPRNSYAVTGPSGGERLQIWWIRIVNHRSRPITVVAAGIRIQRRITLAPTYVDAAGTGVESPFPKTLTDGESVDVFILNELPAAKVRGAWAADALGRTFRRRYPFNHPIRRMRQQQANKRRDIEYLARKSLDPPLSWRIRRRLFRGW
jgi:hypothetical protein